MPDRPRRARPIAVLGMTGGPLPTPLAERVAGANLVVGGRRQLEAAGVNGKGVIVGGDLAPVLDAIADVIADAERSAEPPEDARSWVDCVSGALTLARYKAVLQQAGFGDVTIDTSHAVMDGFTAVIVRGSKLSM